MAVRYKLFVKGKLQWSIILNILMIVIMILTIAGIDLYVVKYTLLEGIADSAEKTAFLDQAETFAGTNEFQFKVLVLVLINIVILFLITFLYSHRIAGPSYKIEKTIAEMIEKKDLSMRISLRKGDQISDISDSINSYLGFINSEIKQMKEEIDVFNKRYEALMTCEDKDINSEAVSGIAESIKRLNEKISLYRLEPQEKSSETEDKLKI